LSRFNVGQGRADAVPQPVVAEEYAGELYRGVKIRASTANNVSIYVGSSGVSASDGFELPAGQEVEVEIDNASNVYVVSSPAGNSQQSVTLSGVAIGDTFTLSFNGQTTAPIAENALASAVQAALVAAAGANFTVTGSAGGPYTVAFSGGLAGQDVPLLVAVGIGVNEQETLVLASPVAGDQMVLTLGTVSAAPLPYNASVAQVQAAMDSICGAGNSSVAAGTSSGWVVTFIGALAASAVAAVSAAYYQNEKQTVSLDSSVTGGTFTLSFSGQTTTAIAYNATAPQVQAALDALSTIGAGGVSVSVATPSGWLVEFSGSGFANAQQALLTGTGTNLVGTVKTVAVAETVIGHNSTSAATISQAHQAAPGVAVAVVANASDGSKYSWLSA
jgi:hypothetical protein